MKKFPNKPKNAWDSYLKYTSLAFQMMASIGVMAWVGFKIDACLYSSFPIFFLTLPVVTMISIIYLVIKKLES